MTRLNVAINRTRQVLRVYDQADNQTLQDALRRVELIRRRLTQLDNRARGIARLADH